MPHLQYWVCNSLNDSRVYSFRAKTRRECSQFLHDAIEGEWRRKNFSKPVKVEVEYADAFDLLCQCSGEGGLMAEARTCYSDTVFERGSMINPESKR